MKSTRALPHETRIWINHRLTDERGLEMVEYALISAIIIGMLAIAVPPLADELVNALNVVTARITEVVNQM